MDSKQVALMAVFAIGAAQAQVAESPFASFEVMSPQNNTWENRYPLGAIVGFALFGLAYVITVIKIFIDINQRMKEYDEVILDDLSEMSRLGMDKEMSDIRAELV